jgi:hypothetical protein
MRLKNTTINRVIGQAEIKAMFKGEMRVRMRSSKLGRREGSPCNPQNPKLISRHKINSKEMGSTDQDSQPSTNLMHLEKT